MVDGLNTICYNEENKQWRWGMDKVRVLTKAANILDLMTKDLMVWDPAMRDMLEEVVADLREMRADLLDRGDLLQHNE
jgi:hypothetical protein